MAIKKASDLEIGKVYYLALVEKDSSPEKVILEEITYPSKVHPELSHLFTKALNPELLYLAFDTWTIGIGETKKEARANFGKIK